jgi:RNA polymerase sigma-70 factor (ECF subfamily)
MTDTPPEKPHIDPTRWLELYGDYLFRFALSRVRDPEAAEELVQQTLVAGFRAAGQYAGTGTEKAWLLGILKRKIIDAIRSRQRQATVPLGEQNDDFMGTLFDSTGHWRSNPRFIGPDPSAALEKSEFWDAFRQCLGKLPGRQADVFVLRELDDQASEEICKELSLSTSNLWVLLHRARLALARCLELRLKNG